MAGPVTVTVQCPGRSRPVAWRWETRYIFSLSYIIPVGAAVLDSFTTTQLKFVYLRPLNENRFDLFSHEEREEMNL